jgi:hypothetical protein
MQDRKFMQKFTGEKYPNKKIQKVIETRLKGVESVLGDKILNEQDRDWSNMTRAKFRELIRKFPERYRIYRTIWENRKENVLGRKNNSRKFESKLSEKEVSGLQDKLAPLNGISSLERGEFEGGGTAS